MKYIIDHDLHIHSNLSTCAKDPEQTAQNILRCAKENGLKTICLTDHFWDEAVAGVSAWYAPQNYPHIAQARPLPQAEGVRFLFGCETDLDKHLTLGLSPEKYDLFDFIIIPTTHMHMKSFTLFEDEIDPAGKAKAWIKRLDAVLHMDLPFHKVGIAHLTCSLIEREREVFLRIIESLPEGELRSLFSRTAALGAGIELNLSDMDFADDEADTLLRIYRIAKACGCKFYLGSDAHSIKTFDRAEQVFARAVELLGLTEADKFTL